MRRAQQLRPDAVEQSADGVDRPRGQPARLLLDDRRSVPDLLHRSSAEQEGLHEAQRHRPDIERIPARGTALSVWVSKTDVCKITVQQGVLSSHHLPLGSAKAMRLQVCSRILFRTVATGSEAAQAHQSRLACQQARQRR